MVISRISSLWHVPCAPSFAKVDVDSDSRRILKVKDYISNHFTEEIRLADLADLVGMSATSFSRFFKLRTSKTLSDYVVEMRLGVAARKLVDTTDSISEICRVSSASDSS